MGVCAVLLLSLYGLGFDSRWWRGPSLLAGSRFEGLDLLSLVGERALGGLLLLDRCIARSLRTYLVACFDHGAPISRGTGM